MENTASISKRTLDLFSDFSKEHVLPHKMLLCTELEFFTEVFEEIELKPIVVLECGARREAIYIDKSEVCDADCIMKSLRMAHTLHDKVNCILATPQMRPLRVEATLNLALTSFVVQHILHEDIEINASNSESKHEAVMQVRGIGIEQSNHQFDHDHLTFFKPMVLEREQPADVNFWTHPFFFRRTEGK